MDWKKLNNTREAEKLGTEEGFYNKDHLEKQFSITIHGHASNISSYIYLNSDLLGEDDTTVRYRGFVELVEAPLLSKLNQNFTVNLISFTGSCNRADLEGKIYKLVEPEVRSIDQIYYSMEEIKLTCVNYIFTGKKFDNVSSEEDDLPKELQLALDAYKHFSLVSNCSASKDERREWIQLESKKRGITHGDGDVLSGVAQRTEIVLSQITQHKEYKPAKKRRAS